MDTVHSGATATSTDTARLRSPILFYWTSLQQRSRSQESLAAKLDDRPTVEYSYHYSMGPQR
jgi:hypothetical protein